MSTTGAEKGYPSVLSPQDFAVKSQSKGEAFASGCMGEEATDKKRFPVALPYAKR